MQVFSISYYQSYVVTSTKTKMETTI